jgi:hypothetical protein
MLLLAGSDRCGHGSNRGNSGGGLSSRTLRSIDGCIQGRLTDFSGGDDWRSSRINSHSNSTSKWSFNRCEANQSFEKGPHL